MRWIATAAKDVATATLEKQLWEGADSLRANSGLTSAQYSQPVLGLIFLRFADAKFAVRRAQLAKAPTGRRGSRVDDPAAYHESGVLFLPAEARFADLLEFPEGGKGKKSIGQALDDAMRAIERDNPQLSGVLPKTYQIFNARLLKGLLKTFSTIPLDLEGDSFGKIYEYFLAEFAMNEGQGGGEFYTPTSIVRLMVEILEPFEGRVLDPACGSGGMFVQSARFVAEHQKTTALSIHGIEKVDDTGRLCPAEPGGARAGRRHPARRRHQQLLRRSAQSGRAIRLLAGESAVQRRPGRQGSHSGRGGGGPAVSVRRAEDGQRELPVDPDFLCGVEREGPRGVRDGELGVGRAQLGIGVAQTTDRGARRRRDGLGGPEHVLHGDVAVHAVVPGSGQPASTCASSSRR